MGLAARLAQVERRGARHSAPSASPAAGASPPLTGEALADRLGVSGETVRRWGKEGMPACGVHPERPAWPVYDEAACRLWAAAIQPDTALRPPSADPGTAAADAHLGAELARERLRSVKLRNEKLEQAIREKGGGLLRADEVQANIVRLNAALRQRFEALPARATPRILRELRASQSEWAVVHAILEDEIRQVVQEIHDDPMGLRLPGAPGDAAGADADRVAIAPERL